MLIVTRHSAVGSMAFFGGKKPNFFKPPYKGFTTVLSSIPPLPSTHGKSIHKPLTSQASQPLLSSITPSKARHSVIIYFYRPQKVEIRRRGVMGDNSRIIRIEQ